MYRIGIKHSGSVIAIVDLSEEERILDEQLDKKLTDYNKSMEGYY
jgi:hypothetical protein